LVCFGLPSLSDEMLAPEKSRVEAILVNSSNDLVKVPSLGERISGSDEEEL